MARFCAYFLLIAFGTSVSLFPLMEAGHQILHSFNNPLHHHDIDDEDEDDHDHDHAGNHKHDEDHDADDHLDHDHDSDHHDHHPDHHEDQDHHDDKDHDDDHRVHHSPLTAHNHHANHTLVDHNLTDHRHQDQIIDGDNGIHIAVFIFGLYFASETIQLHQVAGTAGNSKMFVCVYNSISLSPPTPPPLG